jgi:hypothetical protein
VVDLARVVEVMLDHGDDDEPAGLPRLSPARPARPQQLGVVGKGGDPTAQARTCNECSAISGRQAPSFACRSVFCSIVSGICHAMAAST